MAVSSSGFGTISTLFGFSILLVAGCTGVAAPLDVTVTDDAFVTPDSLSASDCSGVEGDCLLSGDQRPVDSASNQDGPGCDECDSSGHCDELIWYPGTSCELDSCINDVARNCDDGNVCTIDGCDPARGCVYTALDGIECSAPRCDGLTWIPAGICAGGVCSNGGGVNCVDGLECTEDSCIDLDGCRIVTAEQYCAIDGECISAGSPDPENDCSFCNPAKDQKNWSAKEDGTLCGDGASCVDGHCGCVPDCPPCIQAAADDGCGGTCRANCSHVCFQNACCEPYCDGRECGDDGCGGSCGTCDGPEFCESDRFQCAQSCTYPADLPGEWGQATRVTYKYIPTNNSEKSGCHDYTGDGQPDCGIQSLGSQLNDALAGQILAAQRITVVETDPSTPPVTGLSYRFNFLIARENSFPEGGALWVFRDSYDPDTCRADNYVTGATLVGGVLTAGPFTVDMDFVISEDGWITFPLVDCYLRASVEHLANGFVTDDGVFSGIMLKETWDSVLDAVEAGCGEDPVPSQWKDVCISLNSIRAVGAGMFDLHRKSPGQYSLKDAQNPGNASSWCKKFKLGPSNIGGIVDE